MADNQADSRALEVPAQAPPPDRRRAPGTRRTSLELLRDQLSGIDSWARQDRLQQSPAGLPADVERRTRARQRERTAVLARAARQLEGSVELLGQGCRASALLVHRDPWLRGRLAEHLEAQGVAVLAQLDDGADAVGVLVVEQPDLLLVEPLLPHLSGLEVLRRAQQHAPGTLTTAQVTDAGEGDRYLSAGAGAVCLREVGPEGLAAQLLALLHPAPLTLPVG